MSKTRELFVASCGCQVFTDYGLEQPDAYGNNVTMARCGAHKDTSDGELKNMFIVAMYLQQKATDEFLRDINERNGALIAKIESLRIEIEAMKSKACKTCVLWSTTDCPVERHTKSYDYCSYWEQKREVQE